jgi:multidrug efflux pump subunit AcrA (membrane-fusion protein)
MAATPRLTPLCRARTKGAAGFDRRNLGHDERLPEYIGGAWPCLQPRPLRLVSLPVLAQNAPPPAVTVAPAARMELAATTRFNGRLDADRRVAISARVSGTLEEVTFAPGDLVEEGAVLYRIEQGLYAAAVREAEGALRAAEATRDQAMLERDRQRQLLERQTASQAAFDAAEATLLRAEGDVLRLQAALDRARINLSYTEIRAPFAGRVGPSAIDAGALVGPRERAACDADRARSDPCGVHGADRGPADLLGRGRGRAGHGRKRRPDRARERPRPP